MSDWITDRGPTKQDADESVGNKVYVIYKDGVRLCNYWTVGIGQPWQPIPRPAPYVKPKRWRVEYNRVNGYWVLVAGRLNVPLYYMTTDDVYPAVQRIADIYNEVMP
jgi:hypothetical protein